MKEPALLKVARFEYALGLHKIPKKERNEFWNTILWLRVEQFDCPLSCTLEIARMKVNTELSQERKEQLIPWLKDRRKNLRNKLKKEKV